MSLTPHPSEKPEETDSERPSNAASADRHARLSERPEAGRHGQGLRATRLEIEVAILERERDALRARVDELEREVAARERDLERREQQFRQTKDNYEAIIAEKDRAYRELVDEYETTEATSPPGSLPSVFGRVLRRLR